MKNLCAESNTGYNGPSATLAPSFPNSATCLAPVSGTESFPVPRAESADLVSTVPDDQALLPQDFTSTLRIGATGQFSLGSARSLPTATEVFGRQTLAAISSALAHEVRGPLRWVTSFSELLVREEGTSLGQNGKDYLERVAGAAAHLDRVMRDLQTFITAGIQEPRQQTVSLENAMCAVLGRLASDISARNAQVTLLRPLPPVKGDGTWVQQCLAHLLDNALKFVSPGAVPSVRVRAESRAGVVRLYIEDNGPGVPAIHQERIFGLFKRLSHDFPGTGIGLALTRQACERMGGKAGVESEAGKGSRFWIELPKAE